MSRETDTPSSGPDGRGGAAYPSGTPPYGIPAIPDAGTDAGRSAARPEERKTETTLTTRIRINIPGSRPIPPVVVRKPVKDAENEGPAEAEASAAPAPAPAPAAERAALPALPTRPAQSAQPPKPAAAEDKPASDWFAPRKGGSGKGTQGGGSANGAGAPSGSGSGAPGGAPAGPAGPAAPAAPGGARPGAGRPGGVVGAMGAPGGPRPGAATGSGPTGTTGATGGPVAPGHGGGTGSFDVTEALAGGPAANGPRPGADRGGEPRRDEPPFLPDGGPAAPPGQRAPGGQGHPNGPQGPAGPTGGPVTGSGPMARPAGGVPGGPGVPGGAAPAGAQQGGRPGPQAAGGTGLSDDTAILTPQQPAEPGTPGYGPRHDNVSGHTVTSGIPVVPASAAFDAPGTGPAGPRAQTPPKRPEPAAAPPAGSAKPPKKKGRSKLVLLGTGVVAVLAVAYGAGLLMNSSDVPKGTTVLGVDIGGGTRDDAVKKLDAALDSRLNKPLKLSVDGKTVELQPDNAGLQFDTDATAAAAATSDYNPVNVIGSLFGQQRVVDPVMPVDEEKLQAALENAAGSAGSVTEGSIRFESGKAVPVYPKAGQGIDVAEASGVVTEAYRTQVETGSAAAVNVPTSPQQPKVSKAEVDRMLKEFAEPAMSDIVTVQTDPARSIPMSPEKSLWKFLRVQAVGGKLVDKPDLNALKELYGQTFDGVLIARGNGEKTPVTPQDVYGALRQALMSKTDRVAVIETDPS